jgi:hypothetical protein
MSLTASAVVSGFGCEELPTVRFERGEGARLVPAHEQAVADDVGRNDRCEPPLLALRFRLTLAHKKEGYARNF